jgi:atypical dual specificity phosphatase
MARPAGFTWIDEPLLAALAEPREPEELAWLRERGIEVILSLTEYPLPREWIEDAGLLAVNVPIEDMEAPTPEQIDRCLSTIRKANVRGMGVAVHCAAGLGRTGVILACLFVEQGMDARPAIQKVRNLRPGSIETVEQADAVADFARSLRRGRSSG